jgi:hypothetical protein
MMIKESKFIGLVLSVVLRCQAMWSGFSMMWAGKGE